MPSKIKATSKPYSHIQPLRRQFLATLQGQVPYEICHHQGWADYFELTFDAQLVGYGAVKGMEQIEDRNSIFEFYILPGYRQHARHFFKRLLEASRAGYVECQTNEHLLTAITYSFCKNIQEELWLLNDDHVTFHHLPGTVFRPRRQNEDIHWHTDPPGAYLLLLGDKVVAEGGLIANYNAPYADLHMSVDPAYQGRGIGTYFVQELKKTTYLSGHLPVARCQIDNLASLETLQKAGMKICGKMIWGTVNRIQ
ncbi:MAG: GNAT family N-acetyltransferase [Phaeodactylibacter sp.]|uniref:GNAT family N-acetyltransferase n=1 Tax=Phaeodactylibacter sp. TaxID=1940289 RepID=UPI0032ED4A9F